MVTKTSNNTASAEAIIAAARKHQQERENTYRGQALKMYPWVCGKCSREFTHSNVQELTVHHKDHNHDNNPADGSNWELLCLYCHDNEHQRYEEAQYGQSLHEENNNNAGTHQPFAGLNDLLKK